MGFRLQAFICTWRGHEARAVALERKLRPLVPLTVINSDPSVETSHDDWIHLGESAYFAAQWNEIVQRFDADALLHVQADADSHDFPAMMARACDLLHETTVGIYEPDVSYTDLRFDRARLRMVEPDLFEVPLTDCTCWFMHGEVVRRFRPFDLAVNVYGWGVTRVMAALARSCGRICVRDYAFTVQHPQHRGYATQAAVTQMQAYFATLPQPVQTLWMDIVAERRRVALADDHATGAPPVA